MIKTLNVYIVMGWHVITKFCHVDQGQSRLRKAIEFFLKDKSRDEESFVTANSCSKVQRLILDFSKAELENNDSC